jgi:hypothetical protein
MPSRNPKAVRQPAIAAVRQRTSQPANPTLDPVFVALNPGAPCRPGSGQLSSCMRGSAARSNTPSWANVVVELDSEPRSPVHRPGLGDHPPGRPRPPLSPRPRTVWRPPPHRPRHPADRTSRPDQAQERGWSPMPSPPWRHGAWPRSRVADRVQPEPVVPMPCAPSTDQHHCAAGTGPSVVDAAWRSVLRDHGLTGRPGTPGSIRARARWICSCGSCRGTTCSPPQAKRGPVPQPPPITGAATGPRCCPASTGG